MLKFSVEKHEFELNGHSTIFKQIYPYKFANETQIETIIL